MEAENARVAAAHGGAWKVISWTWGVVLILAEPSQGHFLTLLHWFVVCLHREHWFFNLELLVQTVLAKTILIEISFLYVLGSSHAV